MPIFSFTPGSTKSPVAAALEANLANFAWAREGIGLGLMNSSTSANQSLSNGNTAVSSLLNDSTNIDMATSTTSSNSVNNFAPKILHNNLPSKTTFSSPISVSNVTSFISTNSDIGFGSSSSMRSKFDSESRRSLLANDIAEDKYRTKSPVEFFSRWLRSRSSYMRNQSALSGLGVYKKFIIYGFFGFLILFILVHFFLKFGRQSAENDPFLDPQNDPNLRNHAE
ncbi:Zinc finger protein-like 1 [Tyrophagus putrescentiae]|nr:Zinc finger protein-like 1 [Tyrophagus putrescentiae]